MAKGRLSIVIISRWIYYSRITKTHQSIVPRGLYGSSSSFSSGPRRVLCWWSWQGLCRVALLRPILFFFVFFAVEVLFLPPSNKKTKVKMKIKAKKINSASENAIISDLFTYITKRLLWSEVTCMANDLNYNMAHGAEELFMTFRIHQVAARLKIPDSRSPVMMTGQIFFAQTNPDFSRSNKRTL